MYRHLYNKNTSAFIVCSVPYVRMCIVYSDKLHHLVISRFLVIVILPFRRQPFSVLLVRLIQRFTANIFGRRRHSTQIVSFPTYLNEDALFTQENQWWLEEAAADKNGKKKLSLMK